MVQVFGFLLENLLLRGGTVLVHPGADAGFGFGVSGSGGIYASNFGGLLVGHFSGEDQAGEDYLLISDGIVDFVFWHDGSSLIAIVGSARFGAGCRRGTLQGAGKISWGMHRPLRVNRLLKKSIFSEIAALSG
jgi:hypothetical protein